MKIIKAQKRSKAIVVVIIMSKKFMFDELLISCLTLTITPLSKRKIIQLAAFLFL